MDSFTKQNIQIPEGYRLRPARKDDVDGVVALIQAVDLHERGESDITHEEIETDWSSLNFNLEEDAWVIEYRSDGAPAQRVAGYAEVWNREAHALLQGDGYVHPLDRGIGIGSALLRLQEERARQHIALAEQDVQVVLRNGLDASDSRGRELHENEGFQTVRYFYRMQIDLDEQPVEPEWPDEIELRPFRSGEQDRMVFDASEEAFRDHWSYVPWHFEQWQKRMVARENFDPGLFFIAWAGDQIAGVSLCRLREGYGWVGQLAVRRPWRRLGLGMALLRHSFSEFYQRGVRKVALGVDSSNATGATRLYERAGMRVVQEYVLYEKELRPGVKVAGD